MSRDKQMWEALNCLPDAVEHLVLGDPDEADSVKASDAVKWAIEEIARAREERKPVARCVQAAAGSIVCDDEAQARMIAAVYGDKVLAIVESDAKEVRDVPIQK